MLHSTKTSLSKQILLIAPDILDRKLEEKVLKWYYLNNKMPWYTNIINMHFITQKHRAFIFEL